MVTQGFDYGGFVIGRSVVYFYRIIVVFFFFWLQGGLFRTSCSLGTVFSPIKIDVWGARTTPLSEPWRKWQNYLPPLHMVDSNFTEYFVCRNERLTVAAHGPSRTTEELYELLRPGGFNPPRNAKLVPIQHSACKLITTLPTIKQKHPSSTEPMKQRFYLGNGTRSLHQGTLATSQLNTHLRSQHNLTCNHESEEWKHYDNGTIKPYRFISLNCRNLSRVTDSVSNPGSAFESKLNAIQSIVYGESDTTDVKMIFLQETKTTIRTDKNTIQCLKAKLPDFIAISAHPTTVVAEKGVITCVDRKWAKYIANV